MQLFNAIFLTVKMPDGAVVCARAPFFSGSDAIVTQLTPTFEVPDEVPSASILLVGLIILAFNTSAFANDADWTVRPSKTGKAEVVVTNRTKFPITFAVLCPALAGRFAMPVSFKVGPKKVASTLVDTASTTTRSACQAAGAVGYLTPGAPTIAMRVPVSAAQGVCIGQAYPAARTHLGEERFAIDFLSRLGDPVVAARDGVVFAMAKDFTGGGPDPSLLERANFVRILHDDGSIAFYSHLDTKSVIVLVGQRVKAGQQIAKTGTTGYAQGPHLHFAVGSPALKIDPGTGRLIMNYQTTNPLFMFAEKGPAQLREGTFITDSVSTPRYEAASSSCIDHARQNRRGRSREISHN